MASYDVIVHRPVHNQQPAQAAFRPINLEVDGHCTPRRHRDCLHASQRLGPDARMK